MKFVLLLLALGILVFDAAEAVAAPTADTVAVAKAKARACLVSHGARVSWSGRFGYAKFPGVSERQSWGYTTFATNGKVYAIGVSFDTYPLTGTKLKAFTHCVRSL